MGDYCRHLDHFAFFGDEELLRAHELEHLPSLELILAYFLHLLLCCEPTCLPVKFERKAVLQSHSLAWKLNFLLWSLQRLPDRSVLRYVDELSRAAFVWLVEDSNDVAKAIGTELHADVLHLILTFAMAVLAKQD